MFTVVSLSWCTHIEGYVLPENDVNSWCLQTPCSCCQDTSENWVCLSCYQVAYTVQWTYRPLAIPWFSVSLICQSGVTNVIPTSIRG